MALWLVRAGSRGEYEEKFLKDNRIYLTWSELSHDLSKINERAELSELLDSIYDDVKVATKKKLDWANLASCQSNENW